MALALSGTVNDNQAGILRPRKTATPLIINGDMAIAQRGTTATAIGNTDSGYHVCDRWRFSEQGNPTGEFTISQSTDVPTGQGFLSSLKWDVTTADTSIASDEFYRMEYRTEAQDMKVLKYGTSSAETLTLSFWVKSNKTGNYAFNIRKNDDLRNLTKTYTINSADTWEKKVINIPAETSGAINDDNGIGLQLFWYFATGTDYTGTTQETWGAYADGSQAEGQAVNILDSTSNDWYITGVQLEVGSFDSNSIPDFQFEDRATSLARCMRYFERITTSGGGDSFGAGVLFSTAQGRVDIRYSTVKRANATITFGSVGDFLLQAGNKTQAPTGLSSAGSSLHGFYCHTTNSGFTIGHGCVLLDNGTTDATIDASSEL